MDQESAFFGQWTGFAVRSPLSRINGRILIER